jgi:hypothetical protein
MAAQLKHPGKVYTTHCAALHYLYSSPLPPPRPWVLTPGPARAPHAGPLISFKLSLYEKDLKALLSASELVAAAIEAAPTPSELLSKGAAVAANTRVGKALAGTGASPLDIGSLAFLNAYSTFGKHLTDIFQR